jgi:anhydro-N-acetylmuramic acid kinase
MPELYIGLMSGTSIDGVDGVLADFASQRPQVLAHSAAPFTSALRDELVALNASADNELHRGALAANGLMRVYATVVAQLLKASGVAAKDVIAIGAHGQTVRHRPQEFDGTGYTIQLCNPALLAELTGIDVIADFRSRDVAAGGQGAPLAPFFHRAMFARDGETVGVLNLGGISNLTLLRADGTQLGFDCGPGNGLMDVWCRKHQGHDFDANGAWAASGQVIEPLLKAMLAEPYFAKAPPKSTGRDLFNAQWMHKHIAHFQSHRPADIQATLGELTAAAVANDVGRHEPRLAQLIVCGGGALNGHVMARLRSLLPGTSVDSSSAAGLPPLQVEAAAFAWLARRCVRRDALPLQSTTGAKGARVLGAVYPR